MNIYPININFSFNNNLFYSTDTLLDEEDISIPINNIILLMCNRSLKELDNLYITNKAILEENLEKLIIIMSINCYLEGLLWLNNRFKLTNDQIINLTDNILKNKKINTYKFILNLIDNGFIYDQHLVKLSIINNNIKLLEYCYNNNLIDKTIIDIITDYPNINIIKWCINKNIIDITEFTLNMIRNKKYDIIKWSYDEKYVYDKYLINKKILFNDIELLNFIFIQSGYIHFQNEFVINQILYKKKLLIIDWFLSKNIYFNTDSLFKIAFNDYTNYDEMISIIHICYKHKIKIYDKNKIFKILEYNHYDNNNEIIVKNDKINNIDLDKSYWRYYLFNLDKIDLIECNRLNNKINKKKEELEIYKKLLYKLKLPDDIIKFHIIPYL